MIYQILEKVDPSAYSSSVFSPSRVVGMGHILYPDTVFVDLSWERRYCTAAVLLLDIL